MNDGEGLERVAALLPGYDLGATLGRGGFGLVLAGRHREFGWDVAIKVLSVGEDGTTAAGRAEARALARLDHPHIVRVRDAVSDGWLYAIVMELLDRETLADRRRGLSARAACAVALAVAAGLAEAHRNGVLHRDIKPANILFDAHGTPKVADFGIAKLMQGPRADASRVVGTLRYMAPEQFRAEQLGWPTDLYALGIVLYELLSGSPPFDRNLSAAALVHHQLHTPPPPLAGVPAAVADLVARTLAKDPAARPQSAEAFAVELAHAATDAYGPGWIGGSGIALRLDDPVRALLDLPFAAPPPPVGNPPRPIPPEPAPPGESSGRWAQGPFASLRHHRSAHYEQLSGALALSFFPIVLVLIAGMWSGYLPRTAGYPGVGIAALPVLLSIHSGLRAGAVLREVQSVVFTGPDHLVVATRNRGSAVSLWELSNLRGPLTVIPADNLERSEGRLSALAATGEVVTAGTASVRLWNSIPAGPHLPLEAAAEGGPSDVSALALAPHAPILAVSRSTSVQLWDISHPAAARPLDLAIESPAAVCAIAFSPDGQTIALGSAATVRLWDLADAHGPRRLYGRLDHPGDVESIAFSPDGCTIATGVEKTVHFWDVSDLDAPRELHTTLEHADAVHAVAFSPDGRILAVGNGQELRLWTADRAFAVTTQAGRSLP